MLSVHLEPGRASGRAQRPKHAMAPNSVKKLGRAAIGVRTATSCACVPLSCVCRLVRWCVPPSYACVPHNHTTTTTPASIYQHNHTNTTTPTQPHQHNHISKTSLQARAQQQINIPNHFQPHNGMQFNNHRQKHHTHTCSQTINLVYTELFNVSTGSTWFVDPNTNHRCAAANKHSKPLPTSQRHAMHSS